MKYPLKNLIHEKLTLMKNVYDSELLKDLNKNGADISMRDLNKAMLHLEIKGLISVRWVGKNKRRVEIVEAPKAEVERELNA